MSTAVNDRNLWAFSALWLFASCCAMFAMAVYGANQGRQDEAPALWPEGLESMIEPDAARATLVLFAHPLCPCTRASLYELESIANRLYGLVDLHVLFYAPQDVSEMPKVWQASDLKQIASRIPDAHMHADTDGQIAKHFGAYTSGQVVLYDTSGALQFAGGVTPSRGHTGTNPGRALVISSIMGDQGIDPLAPRVNPVYGCRLHAPIEGVAQPESKSIQMNVI